METQEQTQRKKATKATEAEHVDAITLLEGQHREVESLFKEIDNAGERAFKKKEQLFASIAEKLTMHTKIEETIFYPAAKEADKDLVLESFEEHANVKAMIRKLQRTAADDEAFMAKITVLKEMVQHHVKEEEGDLFPKCSETLGEERLLELGIKMQAKVDHLMDLN